MVSSKFTFDNRGSVWIVPLNFSKFLWKQLVGRECGGVMAGATRSGWECFRKDADCGCSSSHSILFLLLFHYGS